MSRKNFIDPHSNTPIFQQIADELERRILVREVKDGDFLPSVRELAIELQINPNTVAKAYQHLQAKGLAESARGLGLKVKSPGEKQTEARRKELLQEKLDECVSLAKSLAIPIDELVRLIKDRSRK